MSPDEVLYQVGEETGLYWFSGKRPTATWGVVQLVQWPQARRLVDAHPAGSARPTRPPSLVVVAKRTLDRGVKRSSGLRLDGGELPPGRARPTRASASSSPFYVPDRRADQALVARVLRASLARSLSAASSGSFPARLSSR